MAKRKKSATKRKVKKSQTPFFSRLSVLMIVALAGFITFYFWDESQSQKPQNTKQLTVLPINKPVSNTSTDPTPILEVMLVITELGIDRIATARANLLPREVTLAYLSYAPAVKRQADEAKQMGHEVLVQIPFDPNPDPKTYPLTDSQTPDELERTLAWHLNQFDGYTGVINYGGTVFSQNKGAVDYFLSVLQKNNMLFLDNASQKNSQFPTLARARSMAFLQADKRVYKAYEEELRDAETFAKKNGRAIILCPLNSKALEKVEKWIKTLPDKRIRLVPLSGVTLPWKK